MAKKIPDGFYEIQQRQKAKSLLVLAVLILFYILAIGLLGFSVLAGLGLVLGQTYFWSSQFLARFAVFVILTAAIVAAFHFLDARKFGAQFILKRLCAKKPDLKDRYHKRFADTVDEIRIAAGLPRVNAYVLSSFGINSVALIEEDGVPAVAVTEGLLADCTRDEMQAVAAHELAHISRGDAYFVTLVCSLANFFEKVRDTLEPEEVESLPGPRSRHRAAGPALVYLAAAFSSLVMSSLGLLLSRQRELHADAVAVELCRSPMSLARAIYKAGLKNSMIGDFSRSYGPLFIVPPRLEGGSEGILDRLWSSHPPVMKRVSLLAQMASSGAAEVIEQVWEIQRNRDKAKGTLRSFDESHELSPTPDVGPDVSVSLAAAEGGMEWLIRDPGGEWHGPSTLAELVALPYFSTFSRVKNLQEKVEGAAREFLQIRLAWHRAARSKPVDPARHNRCPRCLIPLNETFYEGVQIKVCGRCRGKLVDSGLMERIIARQEVTFSEGLVAKAREFKDKFLRHPVKAQMDKNKEASGMFCPDCGYRLIGRPYNYQYFVPVDKCLSCQKIWFDADELEILQILIEKF